MGLRKPQKPAPISTETPAMANVQKLPIFEKPPEGGIPQSYKSVANSSANVMWRAKVKGRDILADNIPLHMSLKTFNDPASVPHEEIEQKVKELGIQRPDPNKLKYDATTHVSPRNGQTYYMLKLHGTDPSYDKFVDHFKGRGITYPSFMGHITIDKDLHDQIKREGIHPHEVEFSPLMIEHGANNPTHMFPDSQSGNDAQSSITPKKLHPVPAYDKSNVVDIANHKKLNKSECIYIDLQKAGLEHFEELAKGQNGDWKKEGYTISHEHSKDSNGEPVLYVHAYDKTGAHAGDVKYVHGDNKEHSPNIPKGSNTSNHLHVSRSLIGGEHQRKGLATAMHAHAEKLTGKKLAPSLRQTPEAIAQWKSKGGKDFGKSENLEKINKSEDGLIPKPNKDTHHELVLHHGTKSKDNFESFDMKHHASGFYPGVYTTSNPDKAKEFGRPMKVGFKGHLFEIKDHKHADQLHQHVGGGGSGHRLVERLKAAGYHGIKRGDEHIIFDPKHAIIQKSMEFNKSEDFEKLEKSTLKRLGTYAAVLGGLAGSPNTAAAPAKAQNTYSSDRMLNAISQVESSNGKNINHRAIPGAMHRGESAFGQYGLTPVVIRETIKMNPDLKNTYGKGASLHGADIVHYLQDNPGLDKQIAQKHLNRLEHHFGADPAKIAFGWLNGISGTNKALKNHEDISKHWHVKKVNNAYNSKKNGV